MSLADAPALAERALELAAELVVDIEKDLPSGFLRRETRRITDDLRLALSRVEIAAGLKLLRNGTSRRGGPL